MARKFDSGWRDGRLNIAHAAWNVPLPVAGMTFPTIEYNKGRAVGVVNYIRRDVGALPRGGDVGRAFAAFGNLTGSLGTVLPFITVQYDPRNWAMQIFTHNQAAARLTGAPAKTWTTCTELHFARILYQMRDHVLPDVAVEQVQFSTAPWLRNDGSLPGTGWPGQDMSVRRREYEPEGPHARYSDRNPCADIDLAVIGHRSGQVALVVDYKLHGAYIDLRHKTYQALSGLRNGDGDQIPCLIVRYQPVGDRWSFEVMPVNVTAQAMVYGFLAARGELGTDSCESWTALNESQWSALLSQVRAER